MFSLVLVCTLILPGGLAGAATTQVSLLNASVSKIIGTGNITFKGQIEVQNIALQKQVEVYSTSGALLVSASYVGASDTSGYENWEFSTTLTGVTGAAFYVKYTVNGQTYYDNNGGNNFSISTDPLSGADDIVLAKSSLITNASASNSTTIYGVVTLKNLAYQKTVNVTYTTDNWATNHTVAANFSTPHFNDENWTFSITGLSSGQQVKYYVDYFVNNTHYYDNNLKRNYSITMP